jgi:glutathione S-transferase
MWRLYHYPLCPFSRKIRFFLAEKALPFQLVLEHPWDNRPDFLTLNPAGQTPVLVNGQDLSQVIADSGAITAFLEEAAPDAPSLLPGDANHRAEARRVAAWFDQKFYAEVGGPLLQEKMWNRLIQRGTPDAALLRQAHKAVREHLDYVGYLAERRNWLAGQEFSLADVAAAAHISVADYLGGVDWQHNQAATGWYMRIKSRPTFRTLLLDRMPGINPPPHYDQLDF